MCLERSIDEAVVETLHGVKVIDPFRWLEDRTLPETEDWIDKQRRNCAAYFEAIPEYPVIKEELLRRLDVEVVDQPARIGDCYFFRRRSRGQERASLFLRGAHSRIERLLVEPDRSSRYVSVGIYRISSDGKTLAFYKQNGGSDKRSVHLLDVGSD